MGIGRILHASLARENITCTRKHHRPFAIATIGKDCFHDKMPFLPSQIRITTSWWLPFSSLPSASAMLLITRGKGGWLQVNQVLQRALLCNCPTRPLFFYSLITHPPCYPATPLSMWKAHNKEVLWSSSPPTTTGGKEHFSALSKT